MRRADYPKAVTALIAQLKRMPGVGPRSAERMALWMVHSPEDARSTEIADAIREAVQNIRPCRKCGFFSTGGLCEICTDTSRQTGELCVVELATDILPLEKTGAFHGLYHALGGRISPLDNVGPENLRIESLLERVRNEPPSEIILALSGDVEGEATAGYIAELLQSYPVKVSRIAQGMPAGMGLESADEVTLGRALSGRTRLR